MRALALLLLIALGACGDESSAELAGPPPVHEHHAPHGGALQVLGEEAAHVELVLDETRGHLTAYVLDGEAEKAVRIAQPELEIAVTGLASGELALRLTAVANPLTGETVGDTSQFEAGSEKLVGVKRFGGTLTTIAAHGLRFDAVAIGYPDGNEKKDGARAQR
jgi:hypothetical protein